MANPLWPSTCTPREMEWRIVKAGVQFRSPFTGGLQAVSFVGDHWEVRIGLRGEGRLFKRTPQLEATLMRLAGGRAQVDIWNWVRPYPRGLLRGSPTLQIVTVRGDTQVVLTVPAGSTLEAGDLFRIGPQVFMCESRCGAVGTTLTVPLINRVKSVIAETSPVIWDKPLLSVVCPEMSAGIRYQPGMALPSEVLLVEP